MSKEFEEWYEKFFREAPNMSLKYGCRAAFEAGAKTKIDADIAEEKRMEPTLRDQFAMAALQGLMTDPETDGLNANKFAAWAYEYADAMLKEREK